MNTTDPVIEGMAVGISELGEIEGIDVGAVVGADVTKVTQHI